MSTKDETRHLL